MVSALEENQDQDFLGDLFMCLGLGDQWKGQFFTPYCICKAMAKLNSNEQIEQEIVEKGWISVNDPACGAGALLLAFANEVKERGINYQERVLFIAQDIDYLAGMMCYIQLSLLGCPGHVVVADTLAHPGTSLDERGLMPRPGENVWKTPMFFGTAGHGEEYERGIKGEKKNMRRISVLVTAQTLYNLAKLADMDGGNEGRVIDKLVAGSDASFARSGEAWAPP